MDAIISRNKDVQSAGQTIRDAQIGDGRDILDMERCELGMVGIVFWAAFTNISWPEGWIPPQWSDFGFWKEKTASALAEFELYLMLPKSAEQTRQIILGEKNIMGTITCFLYLISRRKITNPKIKSKKVLK